MGHDVFISYSSHDKKVADAACALLEQRGHRCWIAPRDILSGMEWGKAIIDGIRGARVFVLIFSANANRSPQVNREVERAVSNGLPIIPFRIEDVTPSDSLEYFISNQHWLDALTAPMARHLDALAEVAGRLMGAETPSVTPSQGTTKPRPWWNASRVVPVGLGVVVALVFGWLLVKQFGPQPAPPRSTAAPSPESAAERPLDYYLRAADASRGEMVFQRCAACHTADERDNTPHIGPNLYGVMGDRIARRSEFAYSDALRNRGGRWDWDTMNRFLQSPRGFVPGSRMMFGGLNDAQERADVMMWLNGQGSRLVTPPLPP